MCVCIGMCVRRHVLASARACIGMCVRCSLTCASYVVRAHVRALQPHLQELCSGSPPQLEYFRLVARAQPLHLSRRLGLGLERGSLHLHGRISEEV